MLRAPFKSRPSDKNLPATSSTHPTPDLITDGDTPSLPSFHGRARMLRAPFKSRPSDENSPATSSTHPTPDIPTDDDSKRLKSP